MPQDDGGVSSKLAVAKNVLSKANAFQSSVTSQTEQMTGQKFGVSFATEHGRNHQGQTPSAPAHTLVPSAQTNQEAESIRSGLAWRAQQIHENPELDYNK